MISRHSYMKKEKWVVTLHDGDETTRTFSTKKAAYRWGRDHQYYYHDDFSVAKIETGSWVTEEFTEEPI